jgi:hypothetical protein
MDSTITDLPAASPITGAEIIPVVQDGVTKKTSIYNLFKKDGTEIQTVFSNGYLENNGNFTASNNWRTTQFISVNLGENLQYKGSVTVGSAIAIAGYDENEVFVSIILGNVNFNDSFTILTIPAGVEKIRACGFYLSPPFLLYGNESFDTAITKKNIYKSWNAVGNSIIAQDGMVYPNTNNIAKGMQSFVKNYFKFKSYNNYGYSGNSLTAASVSDTGSIQYFFSTWVAADIWTSDFITNDFKKNMPIGTNLDFLNRTGGLTFYGALRELHEAIFTLSPNYLMITSNALKRDNQGYSSFFTNTAGHTLSDYSDALKWVANRLSWIFIDQFKDSGINDFNLGIFTIDGLHPNDLGYERYSGLWITEFNKIQ